MVSKATAPAFLLFAALLLPSCERESLTNPEAPATVLAHRTAPPVWILRDGDFERFRFDRYRLLSMRTEVNQLVLLVSVVGDCQVHGFDLLARDQFGVFQALAAPGTQLGGHWPFPGTTWPPLLQTPLPSVSLVLSHDARRDPCPGRQFQELRFDLTPIKQSFESTFGTDQGTIVLKLSVGRVLYSFPVIGAAGDSGGG